LDVGEISNFTPPFWGVGKLTQPQFNLENLCGADSASTLGPVSNLHPNAHPLVIDIRKFVQL
jgi:hypothetical protein